MSKKLGSLFLTAALSPLQFCGQLIMQRKVEDGFDALVAEDVWAAFERGVTAVATEVGVPPPTVFELLPMAELRALHARLREHQRAVVDQWKRHVAPTGLLVGIADLTIDGRSPDASLCLLRLSQKMQLDQELAVPLRLLSEDIEKWNEKLHTCRSLIEDGDAIERAWRRRKQIRTAIGALVGTAITGVAIWGFGIIHARRRVDAVLAAQNPCAATAEPRDVGAATSEQRAALEEKAAACRQQVADADAKAEAIRAERVAAAEKAAAEKAERKRCRAVGEAMQGKADFPDDTPAAVRPLLERWAGEGFAVEDTKPPLTALPCRGTETEGAIGAAYIHAAAKNLPLWLFTHTLSRDAIALMGAGAPAADRETRISLENHAEDFAKRALGQGLEATTERALAFCRARAALKPRRKSTYCTRLTSLKPSP